MVYIPFCAMLYLHYQMATAKSLDVDIEMQDLVELEALVEAAQPPHPQEFAFSVSNGDLGLVVQTRNALVFLE